jgi:hypothetical protein
MSMVIRGVVYGKTIELREPPDVPDGQEVEVVVRVIPAARPWGEGVLRSAGAAAGLRRGVRADSTRARAWPERPSGQRRLSMRFPSSPAARDAFSSLQQHTGRPRTEQRLPRPPSLRACHSARQPTPIGIGRMLR